MEAVKINIEVSLQEATLTILKQIADTLCAANIVKSNPEAAADLCNQLEKRETEKKPAPAKNVAAVPEDKAPAAPAPSKSDDEITDAQLRQAVKACKDRVPVSEIRNSIFAKYGIESSVECPPARRAELLSDLQNYQPANA